MIRHGFGPWPGGAAIAALLLTGCSKQPPEGVPPLAPADPSHRTPTPQSAPIPVAPPPTAAPVPPPDANSFSLGAKNAARTGSSPIGFRVDGLSGHGWSRSSTKNVYLVLSGPPGGPLGFEVLGYEGAGKKSVRELYLARHPQHADAPSQDARMTVARLERPAVAFRTGSSHATTNVCVIQVAALTDAGKGLLVVTHTSSSERTAPDCELAQKNDAIRPLLESFEILVDGGEACANEICAPKEKCMTVVGRQPDVPPSYECWIPCPSGTGCPKDMVCTMIHDGPGQVCEKKSQ